MKAMSKKLLAIALAVVTVCSMSTVPANAATKAVTVKSSNKSAKTGSISKLSVSVDGKKAAKKVTVYLTGAKKVTVKTATTVSVKGNAKKVKNASKVTYASSNKKVATVSKKGVITVKKTGKATITVKSAANKKKAYKIQLTAKNGVKSMKLSATKATLTEGDSKVVTATVSTYKKVSKAITATSSDKAVATVSVKSNKVTVKAVKAGKATITVTPKYGSNKAKTIAVTVNAKPAPAPVAEKNTKVVFADKNAKTAALTGTVTVNVPAGSKADATVAEVLKAVGGDYSVTIADKKVDVKAGVAQQDLSKILGKDAKKVDVVVTSTKSIAEVLTMVEKMTVAKDITVDATLAVSVDSVKVSNIVVTTKNEVKFAFGAANYTAFVKGGELYIAGDKAAELKAIKTITNNKIVKDFIAE